MRSTSPGVSPPPAAGAATSGDTGGLLGRRRYLDAVWRDGRIVVVEVDGALHLAPSRWWDDQLRRNELMLGDALVLRFPSIVVRTEPALVVAQLRRALELRR